MLDSAASCQIIKSATLTKLLEGVLPAFLEFEAVLPAFLEVKAKVFNTVLKLEDLVSLKDLVGR